MRQTHCILQRFQAVIALMLGCLFLFVSPSFSKDLTNKKTINITAPFTYGTVTNYQAGTAGTINVLDNGTLTVTALLDNNFNGSTINNTGTGVITTANGVNYNNGLGTTSNTATTGKITLGGALTLGAGTFTTSSSEVEYAYTAAQIIASGVVNATYGALTLSGGSSAIKTLGGSVIVQGLVTIAASTQFAVGASNTLTLNAATPFSIGGTFTASASGATVAYNNSSNQYVTGAAYYNLTIANGGTKTVNNGAATVSIAAGGTLTNGTGIFDLASYALTTTATSTISNSGTIQTAGNVTFGAAHTIGGTFIYQSGGASQNVGGASYTTLTLSGTATKVFPVVKVSVSGAYTVSGGTRNYSTGTLSYNGASAQTVVGSESYNDLTITGTADTSTHKTAGGTFSVGGNLTIEANSNLDMASFSISSLGGGTNSGKIMWQVGNAYVGGTGMTEFYGSTGGDVAAGANYGNMLFSGAGMMTFTGSTTATGNVTVNLTSPITINNSVILQINGDFNLSGPITNDGTVEIGN